ncbi:PREDICTED: E3 ubiquitin ligase BIG BROTHER-related isoform X2 [Populus euphratica]|uniref:E3 ubiquitin ligase BIG BROTHER-related isoform X2 n=1 Tax=Populus euphratica TaxID=75702 RepID=A0AAJ6T0A0_POPEU|nr:PREDICTED: E3 ubiquitin ligase BIG BROTHER-related isoform X2 [Populus euphratica]
MDGNNTKLGSGDSKDNTNSEQQLEENPNLSSDGEQQQQQGGGGGGGGGGGEGEGERERGGPQSQTSGRTPFTNLSQVDADLALARTLQEQERAYMMLRMNNDGSDYGSWEAGSYLHDYGDDFGDPDDETDGDDNDDDDDETDGDDDDVDGDAFDVHAHADNRDDNTEVEIDPSVYSSDEAYARALQEAEERDIAARLLALASLNGRDAEEDSEEDLGNNSQETWEEVDPDELSYEELLALGEVVGIESRGLSADIIASLASINYKAGSSQNGSNDTCVICRLDYEDGETLTLLSCKHSYHSECINNWLKINKVCPVCSTEVSTAAHS